MENHTGRLSNLSRPYRLSAAVLLMASVALSARQGSADVLDPEATVRSVFNDERLRLTADCCLTHYGRDSWRLTEPAMIVVHYTAFATIEESYRFLNRSG